MYFTFIFFLCFLAGADLLPFQKEPHCTSRFDFEEKLLEKVIRMDIVMKLYEDNYKKFDSEVTGMKTTVNKALDEFRANSELLEDKISSEVVGMKTTVNKALDELNASSEQLELKADKALTKVQENAEDAVLEIKQLAASAIKPSIIFHVKDVVGQPTADSIITFSKAVENTDNVYNLATGYFIAPRNGSYWFSAQICTYTGKRFSPAIYVGDSLFNIIFTYDGDYGDCSTVNAVTNLRVNDKVCLKAGPMSYSSAVWSDDDNNSNNFMGALI